MAGTYRARGRWTNLDQPVALAYPTRYGAARSMAHFAGPDSTQAVPQGVRYWGKSDGAPNEVWKVEVPLGTPMVSVNLWGATGLIVTSNDPSILANPIPESSVGEYRVLRLNGLATGTTMLEVADACGNHWVHLQVQVVELDRSLARPYGSSQPVAPNDGSAGGAGVNAPDPVAELLGLIDKQFTDAELANDKKLVVGFLTARKVSNIVQVFLHTHRALAGRKLPTRNAIFVPCHTFEAGFGAEPPNGPLGNWFSVQVLPTGPTQPLFEAFRRRGATPKPGKRDNAGAPSGVYGPVFQLGTSTEIDIPGMVDAQLALQYGVPADASVDPWVVDPVAPWTRVGRALARTDITARQFGGEIGSAGYANSGSDYGATFAASYGHVSTALKWVLGGALVGASETAKAWATAALANAAPKG